MVLTYDEARVLSSCRGVGAKTDVLAEAVVLRKIGVDNIGHLTARHAYRTNLRLNENQRGGNDGPKRLSAHFSLRSSAVLNCT